MSEANGKAVQPLQTLERENKQLKRELNYQQNINRRNQISAEANANLSRIVSAEKSRLEQYMSLLLSNCPDAILLFDAEGKLVFASDSYLARVRVTATSLIRGARFRALLAPHVSAELLEKADATFLDVLKNAEHKELEAELNFFGEVRHYEMQLTSMVGDTGEVVGAMTIFYDTTDLTRAKEEAELARQVAEQSTRAKSDFLSRMSHEMRTPLNAIIGMSGIAQKTDDMERIQYALNKVNEASQHLLGVINDVLDISKIEADKFEIFQAEFDFERMLHRVVNMNNYRVEEKKQKFMVYIDQDIPNAAIGDDQRLAQVITNLLSNASKFTGEGGQITLTAKLQDVEKDSFTVYVSVKDTGIGVSREQQKRLFSSFEQADGSISRRYGGTGLGLSISKRIIELMGGEIGVKSVPEQGSEFYFSVPLLRGVGEKRKLREDAAWSNIRVLAVDDAPEILSYFSEVMAHNHAYCDLAESGAEALKLIKERGAYDIYFIDWQMPEMDGITLSKKIKEQDGGHSVVIMISATDWELICHDAKAAGVDRFLPKPLFPEDITNCIADCLGGEPLPGDEADEAGMTFAGARVLLAEDIEINREIVLALLADTELTIDVAENGREAVEKFVAANGSYDLVFMDIQMPEMDGYEATRRIRALGMPCAATIPIIAMTANVFREDIERCLEAGMNGHIGKPINQDEILEQLKKYLKK